MALRVLIGDDHQLLIEGLRALLEQESDIVVVGEAHSGEKVVELTLAHNPDVVLLDITMPHTNGIEAARILCQLKTSPRIIALSMHAEVQFVEAMMNAGAAGYVLKDAAFEELAHAVRIVAGGEQFVSPLLADRRKNLGPSLSARERQVLKHIADGHSTKRIAGDLVISIKTVESHRRQIMQKLELYSVAELTKYAVRNGISDLS